MEKPIFIYVPYERPERAKEILKGASRFNPDELTGLSVFINNYPPKPEIIIGVGYTDEKVLKWVTSLLGVTIDFRDITEKLIFGTKKGKYNAWIGTARPEAIDKLHFQCMKKKEGK